MPQVGPDRTWIHGDLRAGRARTQATLFPLSPAAPAPAVRRAAAPRLRVIELHGREGVDLRHSGLHIADNPIDPQIRHFDLDWVRSRLQRSGHVRAERGLPENAQRLAVDGQFRDKN